MAKPLSTRIVSGMRVGGKYRVENILGRGGMGVVVSATHEVLRQRVALKFLLPEALRDKTVVERFLREARAAARIQSDHVARVMDVGEFEEVGSPYIVMEFLEGEDLRSVLRKRGILRPVEAVDYVLQALDAIAEAHSLGIIHRDLKPSNLFLAQRSDGNQTLKVLDFGLSKIVEPFPTRRRALTLTMKGHALGTPLYASPEQCVSPKDVDGRTDIWSLGVILYESLAGRPPFTGRTAGEIMEAILDDFPRRIRERRPEVPAELEEIVFACLTRERDDRMPNAAALAEALAPFGTEESKRNVARIVTMAEGAARQSQAGNRPRAGEREPQSVRIAVVRGRRSRSRAAGRRALLLLGLDRRGWMVAAAAFFLTLGVTMLVLHAFRLM